MTPREEWRLDTRRLGRRVLVFEQVDSTNTQALALADDPGQDGLVILAGEQTAGRGQQGRSWQCAPGAGVLLSVLLFPPPVLRRPALLTSWAAVSVCEIILQSTGLEATIKWPNDVLLRGRKVCGILIEQARGTVIGIGLNVNQTQDDLAGLPQAGSLAICTGKVFECRQMARALIQRLDGEYDRLCAGDLGTLEACWKGLLGLLGEEVTVECHDRVYQGRLREMAWDSVVIEQAGGELLRLRPEVVKHLQESGFRSKESGFRSKGKESGFRSKASGSDS